MDTIYNYLFNYSTNNHKVEQWKRFINIELHSIQNLSIGFNNGVIEKWNNMNHEIIHGIMRQDNVSIFNKHIRDIIFITIGVEHIKNNGDTPISLKNIYAKYANITGVTESDIKWLSPFSGKKVAKQNCKTALRTAMQICSPDSCQYHWNMNSDKHQNGNVLWFNRGLGNRNRANNWSKGYGRFSKMDEQIFGKSEWKFNICCIAEQDFIKTKFIQIYGPLVTRQQSKQFTAQRNDGITYRSDGGSTNLWDPSPHKFIINNLNLPTPTTLQNMCQIT